MSESYNKRMMSVPYLIGILIVLLICTELYFMTFEPIYVTVPEYHNNTIERVEVQACNLSCIDARNEGYLEAAAACNMQEAYITGLDGKIRSYVNNPEGLYNSDGVLCVQTEGRSSDHIISVVVHELIHREQYEFDESHFCDNLTG